MKESHFTALVAKDAAFQLSTSVQSNDRLSCPLEKQTLERVVYLERARTT